MFCVHSVFVLLSVDSEPGRFIHFLSDLWSLLEDSGEISVGDWVICVALLTFQHLTELHK